MAPPAHPAAMSNTTAGWAAAAGADSKGHSLCAAVRGKHQRIGYSGHSLPSNEISNEIRWALVFVTTRGSDVFVTSLSNRYYSRTSIDLSHVGWFTVGLSSSVLRLELSLETCRSIMYISPRILVG